QGALEINADRQWREREVLVILNERDDESTTAMNTASALTLSHLTVDDQDLVRGAAFVAARQEQKNHHHEDEERDEPECPRSIVLNQLFHLLSTSIFLDGNRRI